LGSILLRSSLSLRAHLTKLPVSPFFRGSAQELGNWREKSVRGHCKVSSNLSPIKKARPVAAHDVKGINVDAQRTEILSATSSSWRQRW